MPKAHSQELEQPITCELPLYSNAFSQIIHPITELYLGARILRLHTLNSASITFWITFTVVATLQDAMESGPDYRSFGLCVFLDSQLEAHYSS